MPEERQAPQIPELNLEAEPLKLGFEVMEDAYALSTVKQTFWQYEWFRSQNHDPRWNSHDALYTGWVPPKTWEGTTTPRSSLGMPITFSQIETVFPALHQALFAERVWFEVDPEPGVEAKEADDVQAHLKYAIEHPKADYTGSTEVELELAEKQMLQHGNGGGEIVWDSEGSHPRFEWVDLRDIYFDPGCPTPSVDHNRSIIRRKMMTVQELDDLRKDERMRIPSKPVLMHMARNLNTVIADRTKQTSEALRGIQYNPAQHEGSPLPSERKIEVLIYYSPHKIIWVLNREWIAYNSRNPYGFIPFVFAPCFPVPGRFYAQSYADVIENPQRYIEALYNGRLDELALQLRPPRVRKRGSILTPSQQRWGPGQVSEADDPSKDMAVHYPQGATANVMDDIAYLETMVERLTGANAVNAGVPRPGNANRTATGMNLQSQGGNSRLWPLVKHMEDYLIIPMLYKMYKMVQVHTYPQQQLPAVGQDGKYSQIQAGAFKGQCRFTISASSKMMTREKLAQIVPFIGQYMLNGPFIQSLQAMGQTVDFQVYGKMIQDATGTGDKYQLIRPLNQQEQQAKQAPNPQVVADQQKSQAELQTRQQLMQTKVQGELQKAQIMKAPDPGEAQAQQQQNQADMMKSMVQMAIEKQKAQLDQQKSQHKMLIDHQTAQQKMAHERQAAQQKMFSDAVMTHQQLQASRQQASHDLALQQAQGQQKMQQDQVASQQKVQQSQELTKHKMSVDKQKMALQVAAQRMAAKNKPAPKKAA